MSLLKPKQVLLNAFNRALSLKSSEYKLLLYSLLFILSLFASYAILRPLRDALGIENGSEELKWLFLYTFIATLLGSLLAMYISGIIKRKHYINAIFIFFTLNLLGFYIAWIFFPPQTSGFYWLSRIFYVWVSVFNMFVISSAWSLLADIFTRERSKRLFGIIAAGASLGSILGAFLVGVFSTFISVRDFILIAVGLLCFALGLKMLLLKEARNLLDAESWADFNARFALPIGSKNPFLGFKLILQSPYLLALLGFILLLTSVSTFLYMEQARVISAIFPRNIDGAIEVRSRAFAMIDLVVQSASFIIQIFFTAKIAQHFGIKWLLGTLGFIIAVGFIVLTFLHSMLPISANAISTGQNATFTFTILYHPAFLGIVIVMCIRRIGEYAFIKPGREMLFVPLGSEEKYKVKNFLDTVVYRGGDAISAQIEGILAKFSISATLLFGAFIAFAWAILGRYLGKCYEEKDNKI